MNLPIIFRFWPGIFRSKLDRSRSKASDYHPILSRNHPIPRCHPQLWSAPKSIENPLTGLRNPSTGIVRVRPNRPTDSGNLPAIQGHRASIHRPGCRNQGVESSDNRQMIHWIRQTALTLTRSGRQLDHRRFVNWFAVSSDALNPSTSYRANARICHLARQDRPVRFLESSDVTSAANLPIIYRFLHGIFRFAGFRARGKSSTNLNRFLVIVNSAACPSMSWTSG